jgi:MFS family permease
VVAVLTLANISAFIDRQILSLLVQPIKRDLEISDTRMSYLLGLSFALLYSVLALPIARWADRSNRRSIIAGGIAVWSVMTFLCGLARSYRQLLLARFGVGVGEASLTAPAVSLLADYFPRERLNSAMSVYSMGVFLGSGLAYLVGGWVVGIAASLASWHISWLGVIRPWQWVFLLVGVVGLFIALLMLTVCEPARARDSAGTPAEKRQPLAVFFGYVGANRRTFATVSLGFAFSATVNYGIAAWLVTFFARAYGWTPMRAGAAQGLLTMTVGTVGVLCGGRVADALVRRGRADGALRVGVIGALGMLVAASVYPMMPSAALAVAWLVPVNFFAAFPWGAASSAAAQMAPAALRAQGAALYFLVLNLISAALGPSAVAWTTDFVFRDESALRYSLVVVNVLGMALAVLLLVAGLPAFRRTLANRDRWVPARALT